ncbi:MAG: hypothetical protein EHM93_09920 [Bacteroidales bacterium]|nr:MAG: hypothetical protein EHM93_09920 [Bacteroidales bacterium]
MLFRNKYIFLIILLFSISQNLFAQYKGGNSNGGDSESLTQSPCSPPENSNIYFGGDANGAQSVSIIQSICTIPINASIYFGGNANGASAKDLIQSACSTPENLSIFFGGNGGESIQLSTLCTPPENNNIYYGGDANGAASQYITNCPVAIPLNIFNGGIADGFSKGVLSQSSCSLSENYNIFFGGNTNGYSLNVFIQSICSTPESLNVFFGGNADGFTQNVLTQSVCPPADNSTISLGGNSEGYSLGTFTQLVCSAAENSNIFFGGNTDGYSIQNLTQSLCAVPENSYIFTGGSADGQDIKRLTQSICPVAENFNIFFGGNTDGFAFSSLTQTICSVPENFNIFKGGNTDGFTLSKFTQSVCSTPENLNIFSGGVSNGDAFQYLISCALPEIANIYFGGDANGAAYTNITICPVNTSQVNIFNGGNANGAANQRLIQNICTPPVNLNIYLGGAANGAENLRVIRSICTAPENQNIYIGGTTNGAANMTIIRSICTPPENFNIYLGGNANGAGNQIIMQSICPISTNWNIFFGGKADGFATRSLLQPFYWTGNVDHNWHDPLNWSLEVVPDISSLVIIPNVVNYPIVSNSSAVAKSIVLQLSARLDINKDLTTEFSIINDGTINITGSPSITIGGDLHCENGLITTGDAKFIFNAATGIQTVNFNNASVRSIDIETSPSASCQLEGNITILQNLNIVSGSFNASTFNITINGNWNNSGSFIPGIGAVTFNGTSQSITNTLGEHFYNLVLQNNSQLVINNNIQVSNNLTLTSGIILTSTNILTLGTSIASPGTLTYSSGRIVGKFEKWIASNGLYFFPIGTPVNSQAVNINVNSGLTPGSIVVYFVSSNPGSGGLPISESGDIVQNQYPEGYWNVTANNGFAVTDFNISLEANGFSTYYFNSYTRIIKRTNSGGWHFDGNHVNAASPNCYRNNLTGGISSLGTQFGIGAMSCYGGAVLDNYLILVNEDVPAFVNVDIAKGGADLFNYTWQYTTNALAVPGDTNWTNIPLSNTNSYDYGTLSNTTRFIRKATSVGCLTPVYSNMLIITVNIPPVTGPIYQIPNSFAF